MTTLEQQVEATKAKVERTMVAIEAGAGSMVPRLKQHEAELLRLEKALDVARRKVAAQTTRDGSPGRMKALVHLFKALKTTTDEHQLRALREQLVSLINEVVEKIVLYPRGRKITGTKEERFIDVTFKNGAERRIEPDECDVTSPVLHR